MIHNLCHYEESLSVQNRDCFGPARGGQAISFPRNDKWFKHAGRI
jgi:hypothetical protein